MPTARLYRAHTTHGTPSSFPVAISGNGRYESFAHPPTVRPPAVLPPFQGLLSAEQGPTIQTTTACRRVQQSARVIEHIILITCSLHPDGCEAGAVIHEEPQKCKNAGSREGRSGGPLRNTEQQLTLARGTNISRQPDEVEERTGPGAVTLSPASPSWTNRCFDDIRLLGLAPGGENRPAEWLILPSCQCTSPTGLRH
jgi:hypothetical protein